MVRLIVRFMLRRLLPTARKIALGGLALACSGATVESRDPTVHADAVMNAWIADGELPGAQYLVVDETGVIYQHSAGVVDVAATTAVNEQTMMMAFSITKAITAVAVLRLVDAGKLELDAPLSRYYDAHPYGDGVTLRQLLTHTAGVPNPAPLDWFAVEGAALNRSEKLRQVLEAEPELDDDPGESYAYSNLGYWLIEKAIESASGTSYATYVQTEVFGTVGVGTASASFALPPGDTLARGHSGKYTLTNLVFYALTPSEYWLEAAEGWSRFARVRSHGLAYGGLYCTAEALGKVLTDLLRRDSKLLTPKAKASMFEATKTNDGERLDVASGWVLGSLDGESYFGKQGGGLGFGGNVRIYPGVGLGTVFLANKTEVSPSPLDERSNALDAAFVAHRDEHE